MEVNDLDYYKIGQRIKAIRKERGMQQAELAFRAGLTASHMSHIENGHTKMALPTIVRIANVLSVSVDEFLCDSLTQTKSVYDERIAKALEDCDTVELEAFLEIIQSAKTVIRKSRKIIRTY